MDTKQEKFLINILTDEKHNLVEWAKNSDRMKGFYIVEEPEQIDIYTARVLYLNWCIENPDININAKKLADHFGKDHKFIDRYANYGNSYFEGGASKGKETAWFSILDYLMVLDHEKPRQYAEWIMDEEEVENCGINIWECVYCTVDGETKLKYIDDGWEEEETYDDYYDQLMYEEFMNSVNIRLDYVTKELKKYSPKIREHVVNNFDMFWYMTPEEVTFITAIQGMNEEKKAELRAYMESIPVSMEMIKANGRVQVGDLPLLAFLIDESMSNSYYFVFCKWKEYEAYLKNYRKILITKEAADFDEELLDKLTNNISSIVNCRHAQRYDVEKHTEVFLEPDAEEFADILERALAYSEDDWYFLYLLSRIQVKDYADKIHTLEPDYKANEAYMNERHMIFDKYWIKNYEYQVWAKLSELSGLSI